MVCRVGGRPSRGECESCRPRVTFPNTGPMSQRFCGKVHPQSSPPFSAFERALERVVTSWGESNVGRSAAAPRPSLT